MKTKIVVFTIVIFRVLILFLLLKMPNDGTESIFWSDSRSYINMAEDMSDGTLDSPIHRLPGYPLLILASGDPTGTNWINNLLIIQSVLDLIIAFIIYYIVKRTGFPNPIWPSIIYLVHPLTIVFSTIILPAVFSAFVLMLIFLIYSHNDTQSIFSAIMIGLLLSFGIAVKPMLIYSSLCFVAVYGLEYLKTKKHKLLLVIVIICITSMIVPIALKEYNNRKFSLNAVSLQSSKEMAIRLLVYSGKMTEEYAEGPWMSSVYSRSINPDSTINYVTRDSILKSASIQSLKDGFFPIIFEHAVGWIGFFNPEQKFLGKNGNYIMIPLLLRVLVAAFVVLLLFIAIVGTILGVIIRCNDRIRNFCILSISFFLYASVIHATLCNSYYSIPFLGIWITSGYLGFVTYGKVKLKEPNSLLSRIVKRYRKKA